MNTKIYFTKINLNENTISGNSYIIEEKEITIKSFIENAKNEEKEDKIINIATRTENYLYIYYNDFTMRRKIKQISPLRTSIS